MNIQSRHEPKARRYVREKVSKYPKLHEFLTSLHLKYCDLTGFLHVLPDYYIIGGAKCGTSSLHQYLLQHPNIKPAMGKELHFFEEFYSRGINWYKVCFPYKFQKIFSSKNFLTGDSTPRYIDHPKVPVRIKKVTPHAKFIILLRNPIDRAFSHYNMNFHSGYEKESFEKAIEMEEDRIKGEFEKMILDDDYNSREYYGHAYLNRGIYYNRLVDWFEEFSQDQFLIIKSEEFFTEPESSYNHALRFLNLKPQSLKEYKKYKVGKYAKRKMEKATREKLINFFKPYNEKLKKLTGINFNWE